MACEDGASNVSGSASTSGGQAGMGGAAVTTGTGASAGAGGAAGGGGNARLCGNGLREADELCDDGNLDSGDGCAADCTVEPDHHCRGDSPSVCLPLWPIDLVAWIQQAVTAYPGANTEGFVVPDPAELSAFYDASAALMADDWAAAEASASLVGYQAVLLQDNGTRPLLLALVPEPWSAAQPFGGDGRGVFIARATRDSTVDVVLEAPHPRYDTRSGLVAAMAFRQLAARALAVAGTHRCANMMLSMCSGTTGACGGSGQPYRESDMAHTADGFFQAFHEAADAAQPATLLQVHGMSSAPDEPIASISDGTSANLADEQYASNQLAAAIGSFASAAGSSKDAGSCNRSGDPNLLCGSTNTQGRFTNGVASADVCTMSSGGMASGRFLHAELAPELRDPNSSIGPQVFIDALASSL